MPIDCKLLLPFLKVYVTLILLLFASNSYSQIAVTSFQKISDIKGNFESNLDVGDYFGTALSSVGDLDNDGLNDLIVGANNDDDGGPDRGAIYILYLNEVGSVKSKQKISSIEGNFKGSLGDGDRFGISAESIGDINNDGVVDIAVGANYDSEGGYQTGAVWILFLNSDGTVKNHQKINSEHGNFNVSLPSLASFGSSISALGDLDEDGVEDIAVGAYRDNSSFIDKTGALYILFMNPDGTVKNYQKIAKGEGGFSENLNFEDYFGGQVSTVGDLDGDGIVELSVSAFRSDEGGDDEGAIWILFMATDGTVKSSQKISSNTGNFTGILNNGDFFGASIAPLGDIDGDSIPDIAVGADRDDDEGNDKGAVWQLLLNKNGTVKGHYKISSTQGCFKNALDEGDFFGGSLCTLKGFSSDDNVTLVVGAVLDDDGGPNKGAVYLLNVGEAVVSEAGFDQTVCKNTAILAGNDTVPGENGEWSVIAGTAQITDLHAPKSEVTALGLGENKFVWTIENKDCGKSASDTVVILFKPDFEGIAYAGEDQKTCKGSTFLSATSESTGEKGIWSIIEGEGQIIDPAKADSKVLYLSLGKNKFVWTITNESCNYIVSDTVIIAYTETIDSFNL